MVCSVWQVVRRSRRLGQALLLRALGHLRLVLGLLQRGEGTLGRSRLATGLGPGHVLPGLRDALLLASEDGGHALEGALGLVDLGLLLGARVGGGRVVCVSGSTEGAAESDRTGRGDARQAEGEGHG